MSGQNGADRHAGITSVPLAPQASACLNVRQITDGGGTHQLISSDHALVNVSIASQCGSQKRLS